jgi:predicted nucleic acid-binding protein
MILVDTSALIAMTDPREAWHEAAAATWRRLRDGREKFLITDLILAETIVWLRRRAGHALALRAGEMLQSSAVTELAFVDHALLQQAWALFRRYRDQELSLTDCVSFALMRARKVQRAFAFDDDFAAMGFEVLGPDADDETRPPSKPRRKGR